MDLEQLRAITDESRRVSKTYEIFNEESRLSRSRAARVEFLTTVRYIEKYLKPGDRILDIGAGAGEYSFYFAGKGHQVCALELSDSNVKKFRAKLGPDTNISLRQGNALDLSAYDSGSFDIVLMLGPMYHLQGEEDRQRCIAQAKRVCKKGGLIFFAFISNDMVILTELCYDGNFFSGNTYDHESFKAEDFPFVFHTLDQCRETLRLGGVEILHEVASDGVSELLEEKINALDGYGYEQYLRYHFYCCEKPEHLGRSNHLLFVGRNGG